MVSDVITRVVVSGCGGVGLVFGLNALKGVFDNCEY